jgi:putative addiction module component (TIGR02574 family)
MPHGAKANPKLRMPQAASIDDVRTVADFTEPFEWHLVESSEPSVIGAKAMSPTLRDLGIDQMSREDRLRLLGEIWDTLAPVTEAEIPEAHRKTLEHRLASADSDPSAGRPWAEVRDRLRDAT